MSDVKDLTDTDHRELTAHEALREIGRIVGFRGHKRTMLGKNDLNSIYWYLTGEQYLHRHDIGTDRSLPYFRFRCAVAHKVGFPFENEKSRDRPFRSNELSAIVYALRESKDHRQHAYGEPQNEGGESA